jgi:hypothetical protein
LGGACESIGRLAKLLAKAPAGMHYSEHLEGDGAAIFVQACKLGAEGSSRSTASMRIGPGPARLGSRSRTRGRPACCGFRTPSRDRSSRGRVFVSRGSTGRKKEIASSLRRGPFWNAGATSHPGSMTEECIAHGAKVADCWQAGINDHKIQTLDQSLPWRTALPVAPWGKRLRCVHNGGNSLAQAFPSRLDKLLESANVQRYLAQFMDTRIVRFRGHCWMRIATILMMIWSS